MGYLNTRLVGIGWGVKLLTSAEAPPLPQSSHKSAPYLDQPIERSVSALGEAQIPTEHRPPNQLERDVR